MEKNEEERKRRLFIYCMEYNIMFFMLWVRACGLIMVMCVRGKKEKEKGSE
jgi:hypothetical protein